MSTSIDERVVQMSFDNKNFEQGAQESLQTLDKLKQSLNFDGVGNFLDGFGDKLDSAPMAELGNATENTSGKFSALNRIWDTIVTGSLLKLGGKITDLTMNLLDQVNPINQIADGWAGYAQKTEAVQTIMAATREQFSEDEDQMAIVSEQLDRLNWFSDETSYSFLDMTSNIGKFTSQGIKLDDAVTSMMGISNWAAISGAKTQEASRAMYNLSQALGTGSVKLIDWKSIENANMATVEFKQTAIETAEAMGILTKKEDGLWVTQNGLEVSVTNFNENLTKGGWFTSEVLTTTLDKYGKFAVELNNFMELTGDYYDTTSSLMDDIDAFSTMNASEQLTFLSNISKETGVSIEDLREDFEYLNSSEFDLGKRAFKAAQEAKTFEEAIDSVKDAAKTAWMNVFEAIFGNYEQAKVLWTSLANSLWDMFVGPIAALADFMKAWNEGPGNGIIGGRDLLFGLEGVDPGILGNIATALGKIFEAIGKGFSILNGEESKGYDNWLYDVTVKIHDFSEAFAKFAEDAAPTIEKVATAVATFIKIVRDAVTGGFSFIWNVIKGIFSLVNVGQILKTTFSTIGAVIATVFNAIRGWFSKIDSIIKVVKFTKGFKEISAALTRVKEAISNFIDNSIFSRIKTAVESFKALFNKDGLGGIGKTDINVIGIISKAFSFLATAINTVIDKVKAFVSAVQNSAAWTTLVGFIGRIQTGLSTVFETLRSFKFSSILDFLHSIIETLNGFFVNTGIKGAITSLFPFFEKVGSIVRDFFTNFSFTDVFDTVKTKIAGVRAILGDMIERRDFTSIYEWFVKIKDGVVDFAIGIKDAIAGLFTGDSLSDWFAGAKESFSGFINSVMQTGIWNTILDIFTRIKNVFIGFFDGIAGDTLKETIANIADKVGDLVDNIIPAEKRSKNFSKIWKGIKTVLKGVGTVLAVVVGAVAMLVIKVAEFIKTNPLVQKFITFVKNAFEKITPVINSFIEKIKAFGNAIKQNEGFQRFVEVLRKIKDSLFEFVTTKVFEKLIEWVQKLSEKFSGLKDDGEGGVISFADRVGDAFGKLVEWFEKAGTGISGFIEKIKGSDLWQSVSTLFQHIKDGTFEWSDVTNVLEEARKAIIGKLKEIVDPLVDGDYSPTNLYNKAKTALSNFAKGLLDGWSEIDTSAIWSGAKTGGLMFILGLIGLAIFKIVRFFSSLSGLPKEGLEALAGIKDGLKALTNEVRSKTMLNIALAVAVLSGAIALLAWAVSEFGWGNVLLAAGITAGIVTLCTGLLNAITGYRNGQALQGALAVNQVTINLSKAVNRIATLGGIALVMISFAKSVEILSNVAKSLGELSRDEFLTGAKRLLAIAGILVGALAIINLSSIVGDTGEGSLAKGLGALGNAATILAFGEAVRLLMDPLKDLVEISKIGEPADKGAKMLRSILWTLAGSAGVSSLLGGLGGAKLGTGIGNAATIMALALAIRMIVQPIRDLATLYGESGDNAIAGAVMVSAVIAVLALSVGGSAKLAGKDASFGSFMGIAVAVLAIAIAAGLMVKPLQEICGIGYPAVIGAILIGAIIGVLGGAAKLGGGFGSLAGLALDMVALAVSLMLMVEPLKELAKLGWAGIAEAVVVGAVIAAIGLGARLADPLQLLALAAAMISLAGSVWVINEAAKSAGQVSGKGLLVLGTEMALMLAGLVIAVLAIGGAATSVAPGLYALAAAAVGVGLGFALITGSFEGIADSITAVAGQITDTFENIFSDENVSKMAYEAGAKDMESYTAGATAGTAAAQQAYEENYKALMADANNFADTALGEDEDPEAIAARYREKYMPAREEAAATAESIEDSAERIVEADKKITGATSTSPTTETEAEMNAWMASYEEKAKITEDAATRVEASTERMNQAQANINKVDTSDTASATAAVNDILNDPSVTEAIGNVGTANADTYMDAYNTELNLRTEEGKAEYKRIIEEQTGTALTEEFAGISEGGLEALESTYQDYIASITGGENGDENALIPMMRNAITGEQENFNLTLQGFMTQAKEAGLDITRPEYYNSMLGVMGNNEDGLGPGVTSGVYDSQETVNTAVNTVAEGGANTFGSEENRLKAYTAATNFGSGFGDGIMDSIGPVIEQVQAMVDGILSTVTGKEGLDEHSPSKKAVWIAQMFDVGLAVGLVKFAKTPINAANTMTGRVLSEMQSALANADAVLSDNLNPTITPVLDLTDVQNGSGIINDLLGNTKQLGVLNAGINANLAYGRNSAITPTSGTTNGNTITNNFTITVTGGPSASPREIANEVMDRINNDIQRRKAAFA